MLVNFVIKLSFKVKNVTAKHKSIVYFYNVAATSFEQYITIFYLWRLSLYVGIDRDISRAYLKGIIPILA